MEAGLRAWDRRMPEQRNRILIDHISSILLPYNRYHRENLLREGIHPSKIIVTGNDQRREYELGPINTLGRHPDNTLQILDRIVSKEHAQIIRQPDGRFLFRDLGSLNGSFLRRGGPALGLQGPGALRAAGRASATSPRATATGRCSPASRRTTATRSCSARRA